MCILAPRTNFVSWLVIACAVLAGVMFGRPGPAVVAPIPVVSSQPDNLVTVHVSGWVITPGLVELRQGARVAEAIEAAGGTRTGAQTEVLNLAQIVVDGQRIDVPGPGQATTPVADDGKVPINQADAASLEALPGVGPVLAARIVAHREEHGPFQTPEDLLDVPGIGESKLDSLRDLIRVP